MTHVSLSSIKKINCTICNLCIATDIEAAEPRNHHSTCENYLGVWTRDCETFFLLGYPLLAIFSLSHIFPSSFSLGPPPYSFAFWMAVNHSQFRCPYRPFASSWFIRDQKTNRNSQKMPSMNIVHGQCILSRSWKSHGSTWLYRVYMRRERVYERT